MRYAIVKNGKVENIVVWAGEAKDWPHGGEAVDATGANVGDSWDGQKFIKPVPAPQAPEPDEVDAIISDPVKLNKLKNAINAQANANAVAD